MQLKTLLKPLILIAATVAAPFGNALAAYPDKAVKIIVSFPPGGATDVVTRILGAELSKLWAQTVVVENKTGAGGNIGANHVAKSDPDGYTLLMGSPAETVINPLLYSQMQYDAEKDLIPVSKVGSAPLVLVVHPTVPAKNAKELIEYIRKNPKKINYASSGTGGPQHLAAEEFKRVTDTQINHIPYKGGAPAITDLVGGQVQMFFSGLPPALPFIQASKLRALAVTTKTRSDLVPDIPSLAESGLPDFNIENWQGLFAPAGTPAAVIKQISADVKKALGKKEIKEKLAIQGVSAAPSSPAEFASFIVAERKTYAQIIKAANVSVK